MESSTVFDILQFSNCDFIVADSSLHILHSNNKNAVNKSIADVFPYSIITNELKSFFSDTNNSKDKNQSILESPDQNLSYIFSIHKINSENKENLLILSRLKNTLPVAIQKMYDKIYNIKVLEEDTEHFVDVFKYIVDTVIKVTGMDCGGIYVIDPLTQHLKLTFAQGVSKSFIEKVSLYTPDSWNYQLIIKGTPQYIDYTTMNLDGNDFRKQEGIKTIAAIPVVFNNHVIGVINVGSHSTNIIPAYIQPLIEVISQQLGVIIDKFMMKSLLAQSVFDKEKIVTMHDVVYQIDKDTIIRYISPNIENFIGFTPLEMIGKSFVDFIYPEDLPMVLESYERSKRRIIEPLEYRLITKDKSYRYILTLSEAYYDGQGNYIGLSGVGTDIHEKKLAELRLKESEEKFKTLANYVLTSIFIIQDNIIQWINPATADILEYSDEEIIGKPFYTFVHPDDVEQVKLRAAARQRGEDVVNRYEARIVTKNNTVKWIDFHVATIQYNGRLAILGSATDVTDRKNIELELKTSEEKFYKAFHFSPIPMTINTFKDGVYREVNEAACQTFGYLSQEAVGRSIFDLNVFADKDELDEYVKILQTNRKVKDFNVTFRTKNGLLKDCIINSDIFDASNEQLVISSIVDVTQIKRSAQIIYEQYRELQKVNRDLTKTKEELVIKNIQLYDEKERLNRILESINDAVIVTDNNGTVLLVNNSTYVLLEKNTDMLIGKKAMDILTIDCKQPISFQYDEIIHKIKTGSLSQECILFVNNFSYNVELHILPLKDYIGNISGMVIIIRDISQKKKIEEHIARASKLESVGLLAAGIAHDFNNILTSIVGNLSIIKNKIGQSAEFYNNLQEAENASFRAKELTQQLLTLSKGGAPVRKVTSLSTTIKDTATFVLSGSAIKCNFSMDDDLWHVEADEGQISQVIQNIVINAREAMNDHGTLHVYAHNIKDDDPIQSIIGKEKYIKISIEDNGPGIKAENIEKIFDPYFTTKPYGTGLGLTVVYSIIKQHCGLIFVDSTLNKGTRFDIYLKATDKPVEDFNKEYEVSSIFGKGKILVLEDDENIQFILKTMLEELGYEVDIANDGDEALEKYEKHRNHTDNYLFAIMDLTIPGKKGGKETIKQIRQIDKDFRVIVSSGYSNDPVMSNYKEYGFDGILPKPYRFEDLKQIIASLIIQS